MDSSGSTRQDRNARKKKEARWSAARPIAGKPFWRGAIKPRAGSEPALPRARCATELGFSLHAATTASDAAGHEHTRDQTQKFIRMEPLQLL